MRPRSSDAPCLTIHTGVPLDCPDREGTRTDERRLLAAAHRVPRPAWQGAAPAGRFLPSVPGADHANDQRSIQRSPSTSQFEAIWSDRASLSDVAKT